MISEPVGGAQQQMAAVSSALWGVLHLKVVREDGESE